MWEPYNNKAWQAPLNSLCSGYGTHPAPRPTFTTSRWPATGYLSDASNTWSRRPCNWSRAPTVPRKHGGLLHPRRKGTIAVFQVRAFFLLDDLRLPVCRICSSAVHIAMAGFLALGAAVCAGSPGWLADGP